MSVFTPVGSAPVYLLNSSLNNSNISLSSLSITANYQFSVFGTQQTFANIFIFGTVNSANNFTGYLVTYYAATTVMTCLFLNVSFNISNSSVVYLLQYQMQNSQLTNVIVAVNFTYQGGFIGVSSHTNGLTTFQNCSISGSQVSKRNGCSLLFNSVTNSSVITLSNVSINVD